MNGIKKILEEIKENEENLKLFINKKTDTDISGFSFLKIVTTEDMLEYQRLQNIITEKYKEYHTDSERNKTKSRRRRQIENILFNTNVKEIGKSDGKFFVLQDKNDLDRTYFFKTNINNEFGDGFMKISDFGVFMDMMETNYASYAGKHIFINGKKYFGYSSDEIRDFNKATQLWYGFFKNLNKLPLDSEILINDFENILIFKQNKTL